MLPPLTACLAARALLALHRAVNPVEHTEPSQFRVNTSEAAERSPEVLFAAWKALGETERSDTVEWFTAEADNRRDARTALEQSVLRRYAGRRFDWPEAGATPPLYDPTVHTPGLVIERTFVPADSPTHRRTYEDLVGERNDRAIRPAFRYDWGRGTVVKLGAWDDPERVAHNAAHGFGPYADLVEAIVEMEVDGGALRAEAAAFGHAYADRAGNAFSTITIYDAWSSGDEIEMPDVECLGILHDVEDDWRSFVSPVPDSQHRRLYDRIGGHYKRLHAYRTLRTAIARAFLDAEPELPKGYETGVMRLHGFWMIQESDPRKMGEDLPTVEGYTDWFVERGAQADETREIVEGARTRMANLKESRAWARQTFERILEEYGAFQ